MQIKLFTKPFCQDCQVAHEKFKQYKKNYKINIEEYDLETNEGLAEALYYDVFATPTILIDEKELKYNGYETLDELETIIKGDD